MDYSAWKKDIELCALDVISEKQKDVEITADKDELLYLMAFNDGVIKLKTRIIEMLCSFEEEFKEKYEQG